MSYLLNFAIYSGLCAAIYAVGRWEQRRSGQFGALTYTCALTLGGLCTLLSLWIKI